MARESSSPNVGAADTPNLRLKLINDVDAITTTFKQWREYINGDVGSNMQKIDTFAGNTNEALNNKVDKETGKGLSANDFTNADKAKVDAIPANPKYTDTTYTAGEGIAISDTNVISATGRDVTAAGDNTFTGINKFHNAVYLENGVNLENTDLVIESGEVGLEPSHGVSMVYYGVNGDHYKLSMKPDTHASIITSTFGYEGETPTPLDVSFGGSKLLNIGTPTADTDAANKAYVESFVNTKVAETVISNVVQTTGQSTTAVMSQKATTDLFALKSDLSTLSLGVHTDGLVHIFVNGKPVGTGVEFVTNGDVAGYVDDAKNIVITGDLADRK